MILKTINFCLQFDEILAILHNYFFFIHFHQDDQNNHCY